MWHVDQKAGVVELCTIKVLKCPLGFHNHYSNEKEAKDAHNDVKRNATIKRSKRHHGAAAQVLVNRFAKKGKSRHPEICIKTSTGIRSTIPKDVNVKNNQFTIQTSKGPSDIVEQGWANNYEAPFGIALIEVIDNKKWPIKENHRQAIANYMATAVFKNHNIQNELRNNGNKKAKEMLKKYSHSEADAECIVINNQDYIQGSVTIQTHDRVPHIGKILMKYRWGLVKSKTPLTTGNAPVAFGELNSENSTVNFALTGINNNDFIVFPIERYKAIYVYLDKITSEDVLINRTGMMDFTLEATKDLSFSIIKAIASVSSELYFHPDDKVLLFGKG